MITDFSALKHAKIETVEIFSNKGQAQAAFEVYQTKISHFGYRHNIIAYELVERIVDEEGLGVTVSITYTSTSEIEAIVEGMLEDTSQASSL